MTKDEIITEVEKMVHESGFKNTTVALISEKLNISTSILYKHFANKEAIVADVLVKMNHGLKNQAKVTALHSENGLENLVMFRYNVHNFAGLSNIRDRIRELRKYYEKSFLRNNTQLQDDMVEIAHEIIARGQEEGLFIQQPNLHTLSLIFHWTFWTPMSTNLPIPSDDKFYAFHNQLFDIFLHGLLTPEGCAYLQNKSELTEKIHLS
ncbi:MAG: TetR/AcrR family transcriptional regulator [Weeksellaceae bacterium]|nr:TetR/AcrR family transcriptional regulator [Weeksellaceae bacterium]